MISPWNSGCLKPRTTSWTGPTAMTVSFRSPGDLPAIRIRSHHPKWVTPPSRGIGEYGRAMATPPILVAYDGSELAQEAVRQAAALFPGSPAVVITVWEPGLASMAMMPTGFDTTFPDAVRSRAGDGAGPRRRGSRGARRRAGGAARAIARPGGRSPRDRRRGEDRRHDRRRRRAALGGRRRDRLARDLRPALAPAGEHVARHPRPLRTAGRRRARVVIGHALIHAPRHAHHPVSERWVAAGFAHRLALLLRRAVSRASSSSSARGADAVGLLHRLDLLHGRRRPRAACRRPSTGRERDATWWSAAIQFAGTLFFNLSTGDALRSDLSTQQEDRLVWAPDLFGSVCFLVSGVLAYRVDADERPRTMAAVNLAGCVFFMISAIAVVRRAPTPARSSTSPPPTGTPRSARACFLVGAVMLARHQRGATS